MARTLCRARIGLHAALCAAALTVTACGGGGSSGPPPPPPPTATPVPGPLSVSPPKLVFLAVGSGANQTFTASQANFAGPFTTGNGSCAGAVLISPASGTTFTVTPVLPAICTIAVNGANGQSANVAISITQTTGGGS